MSEGDNTQGQGEKIKTSKSAIGNFFCAIMKPKTQLRVGLWGAVFFLVLAIDQEIWRLLPWSGSFLFLPLKIFGIILPVYILGVLLKKGWITLVACTSLTIFFLFYLFGLFYVLIAEQNPNVGLLFQAGIKIFVDLGIPWGFVAFILWLGFSGLDKTLAAKGKSMRMTGLLTVVGIVSLSMGIMFPALARVRTIDSRMQCGTNLVALGIAMQLYAEQNEGSYPVADQWCDLLIQCADVSEAQFRCPRGRKGKYSYAMNPYCEPNSPPDIVLLFETSGGWNQFGGPEILTFENHNGKGCNVSFNDGHVEFVKADQFDTLKWKDEGVKSSEASAEEFARELVEFVEYEGNPVFGGTGEDTWDRQIRERGFILREGDVYRMWYTGYNDERSDMKYLGYATSPDGFKWTRYEGNPIFTERWVEDMFVVRHEGTYYMFAEGRGDIAHLLTSKDGVNWEDEGDLDVRYTTGERLSAGPYGTPTVLIEGDVWYLFYERDDLHVWLAESRDLKVWRNVQDEPVLSPGPEDYDGRLIALDYIIRHEGRYYAYYHGIGAGPDGQEWGPWCSAVAVSEDLVCWEKYPKNPIVIANSPILVDDGDVYRLYCMHPEVRVYFPR